MKTSLKSFLVLLSALTLVVSCGGTFDAVPVDFRIMLVDSEGNNLLDPQSEVEGAIDASKITAQYTGTGEEYQCQIPTKTFVPDFNGLQLENDATLGWMLTFGGFNGELDFDSEELTVMWGDGSSDVIKYDRNVKNKVLSNGIRVKEEWYLNGMSISKEARAVIKIVKNPLYIE